MLKGSDYTYTFNGITCIIPVVLVKKASKLQNIDVQLTDNDIRTIITEPDLPITVPMIIHLAYNIKQSIDKYWTEDKQLLDIMVNIKWKNGETDRVPYNTFLLQFLTYNILIKFELI
ncbi:hypothetical protein V6O07_04810 [Arthrospira platensis SPKY2]